MVDGEDGAGGDDRSQAVWRLKRGQTDPSIALADEQLGRLTGLLAQPGQCGASSVGEGPAGGCSLTEGDQPGAECEPSVGGPAQQPVDLQRCSQAVGGRSTQAGPFDELAERGPSGLDGAENDGGLVDDPDTTYT